MLELRPCDIGRPAETKRPVMSYDIDNVKNVTCARRFNDNVHGGLKGG